MSEELIQAVIEVNGYLNSMGPGTFETHEFIFYSGNALEQTLITNSDVELLRYFNKHVEEVLDGEADRVAAKCKMNVKEVKEILAGKKIPTAEFLLYFGVQIARMYVMVG